MVYKYGLYIVYIWLYIYISMYIYIYMICGVNICKYMVYIYRLYMVIFWFSMINPAVNQWDKPIPLLNTPIFWGSQNYGFWGISGGLGPLGSVALWTIWTIRWHFQKICHGHWMLCFFVKKNAILKICSIEWQCVIFENNMNTYPMCQNNWLFDAVCWENMRRMRRICVQLHDVIKEDGTSTALYGCNGCHGFRFDQPIEVS